MLVAEWPEHLRPLVGKYGAEHVWRVGLGLFGFPPTWQISGLQLQALTTTLFSEFQNPNGKELGELTW